MADLSDVRRNIQVEETRFRGAVSEAVAQKLGSSINFINNKQNKKFYFGFLKADSALGNPTYRTFTPPLNNLGNPEVFEFDSTVVGILLRHEITGSSGTTELDIKWAPANSSTFNSIFSTTPKVDSTAPSPSQFDTFGNATTPTGCTLPVLSKTTFDAGDQLRCDVLQLMSGNPNGFMLEIIYIPTSV